MSKMLLNDAESGGVNQVPKLISIDEYPHWKSRFEIHIKGIDTKLWDMIETGYDQPKDEHRSIIPAARLTDDQRKVYDTEKKTYSYLCQAISKSIFYQYKRYKWTKSLWDALMLQYEENTKLKSLKAKQLKKEFDNFKCLRGENLFNLINRYNHLISELFEHFEKLPDLEKLTDPQMVECLATALPDSWSEYVQTLREKHSLESMKLDDFIKNLREKEQDDKCQSKHERAPVLTKSDKTSVGKTAEVNGESDGDESTTSEESSVSTSGSSDSHVHFAMTANTEESSQVSSKPDSESVCAKCLKLEDRVIELNKLNADLALELSNNKVIKGNEKLFSERNKDLTKKVRDLEVTLLNKQDAITAYLDDIDKLKREKASIQVDFETLNQKVKSYSTTSYLLDHMLREQRPDNGKTGIRYNTCPPPLFRSMNKSPTEEWETEDIVEPPTPVVEQIGQIKLPLNVKSKERIEGNPRDWETDSDDAFGSSGLGLNDQNSVKSGQTPTLRKPELKGPKVVKAGESSLRAGKSGNEGKYSPPHKRNPSPPTNRPPHVYQTRGLRHQNSQRRMMHSPPKFTEWRTCFDCGEKGHVNYNCPNFSQRPRRRVDHNNTFNKNRFKFHKQNRFSNSRSNSPLKNRQLFPNVKIKREQSVKQSDSTPPPSPRTVDQSTTYFKKPLSKTQSWKTKVANIIYGGPDEPDWSKGKWVQVQALGSDGKPEFVKIWVSTENV